MVARRSRPNPTIGTLQALRMSIPQSTRYPSGCAPRLIFWPATMQKQTRGAFFPLSEKVARYFYGANRAVEELSLRLARNLASDQKAACDFFWLYARTRKPADIDISVPHLNLKAVNRDDASAEYAELLGSIADDQKTVIVATTAHIVDQLTRDVTDRSLGPYSISSSSMKARRFR